FDGNAHRWSLPLCKNPMIMLIIPTATTPPGLTQQQASCLAQSEARSSQRLRMRIEIHAQDDGFAPEEDPSKTASGARGSATREEGGEARTKEGQDPRRCIGLEPAPDLTDAPPGERPSPMAQLAQASYPTLRPRWERLLERRQLRDQPATK
ncbi:MAG TPA: hypothetical protein VKB76_01815, partial [Ktedonobacterales bacterium]|nr:hypothetical protein [Ktedonobacterales bacterium]